MGLFAAVASVCAAAGLAVGGFGMASGHDGAMGSAMADSEHQGMQHMAMSSPDASKPSAARVLTKRELAQITQRGTLPVIRGRVTTGARIKVSLSSVPAGRYKFVVVDETPQHNWHIFGPGDVDRETGVPDVARYVWRSRLSRGTYDIVCDVHVSTMHKELSVT